MDHYRIVTQNWSTADEKTRWVVFDREQALGGVNRYYDIIEIWNDKLGKYAKNNGLKILNIDDKVDKKHYFTHDIEPSASGSSVIIDNILKL